MNTLLGMHCACKRGCCPVLATLHSARQQGQSWIPPQVRRTSACRLHNAPFITIRATQSALVCYPQVPQAGCHPPQVESYRCTYGHWSAMPGPYSRAAVREHPAARQSALLAVSYWPVLWHCTHVLELHRVEALPHRSNKVACTAGCGAGPVARRR